MRIVPECRTAIKPGREFGELSVVGPGFYLKGEGKSQIACICQCSCGEYRAVQHRLLRERRATKCHSCADRENRAKLIERNKSLKGAKLSRVIDRSRWRRKLGRTPRTRLYNIWAGMRQRCSYPKGSRWKWYGGRGISVCPEWNSFDAFREWANSNGYADDLSIDRINNDGNYEPENCRWADRFMQARNTSRTKTR